MLVGFNQWTRDRFVPTLGTNAGAEKLPFQSWRHFKEAFAPELVARAVEESKRPIKRCLDPFGGSGTTALASQFLGVEPITIEVNPFLADLIESKLCSYDSSLLARDFAQVVRKVRETRRSFDLSRLPQTFVAPGDGERWLFSWPVAQRVENYRVAINSLRRTESRRLFRVLLGGILVELSNVLISGKGRRYRTNWKERQRNPKDVDSAFQEKVLQAISEISQYADRPEKNYTVLRGDCRQIVSQAQKVDLAVFSPPYPNSFDYTDVYNVELWVLGYLGDAKDNRVLRQATLSSHVQISRDYSPKPIGSKLLNKVSRELHNRSDDLWNQWIPHMVDSYFADMCSVLSGLNNRLLSRGELWAVVGDSQYSNIHIPVAKILSQLCKPLGLKVVHMEAFRSMRSSAQQGWRASLDETLIVFRKQ